MVLVPRHRREVCPLARRVMLPVRLAQPVSSLLPGGLRFFLPLYPHRLWSALLLSYLSRRSDTGLPRSARLTRTGEVLSLRRERCVHDRILSRPCTRSSAFLAQASQHLGLGAHHDVYRECTCVHPTIHPAPSPLDASRYTVPSRFGCQSGACGYRVRRHCTGRYIPAHLRRILLMEQEVWSLQRARRSTVRPRVAADNQPCDFVSQCFLLTVPFRGMLLTSQDGLQCLVLRFIIDAQVYAASCRQFSWASASAL